MEPTTLLALALFGGLVGLDSVSFVQAMISRPVIAGPIAGFILGVPEGGMMAGVVLADANTGVGHKVDVEDLVEFMLAQIDSTEWVGRAPLVASGKPG